MNEKDEKYAERLAEGLKQQVIYSQNLQKKFDKIDAMNDALLGKNIKLQHELDELIPELRKAQARIWELEIYQSAIDQMNYDLYTMHIFIKEKMRDYDIGTRFLVKLANDWVCPATYTSKGWIDDNGNELISVTHYMVMPGVLPLPEVTP